MKEKKTTSQEPKAGRTSSFIAIEGMHFFAHHGTYPEEMVLLSEFLVDIYIHTNFQLAADADDLDQTINYEVVHLIIRNEMKKPAKLLETVVERIAAKLKGRFHTIEKLKLRISKNNPPLRGQVDRFLVEVEFDHMAKCPETGEKFLCYQDSNCWCQKLQVTEETRKLLKEKHDKCIGPDALSFYSV